MDGVVRQVHLICLEGLDKGLNDLLCLLYLALVNGTIHIWLRFCI